MNKHVTIRLPGNFAFGSQLQFVLRDVQRHVHGADSPSDELSDARATDPAAMKDLLHVKRLTPELAERVCIAVLVDIMEVSLLTGGKAEELGTRLLCDTIPKKEQTAWATEFWERGSTVVAAFFSAYGNLASEKLNQSVPGAFGEAGISDVLEPLRLLTAAHRRVVRMALFYGDDDKFKGCPDDEVGVWEPFRALRGLFLHHAGNKLRALVHDGRHATTRPTLY